MVGTADRTPTTTVGIPDAGEPAVLVAGRTPDTPDLNGADPFRGLETVGQALKRVLAEQAERQAPRDQYDRLRSELAQYRRERELLDKRDVYRRSPLDDAHRVLNNAHADVNMLTARYEHAPWRQRRAVGRDLERAQERLEAARAGWEEQYQHHTQRLDQSIDTTQARLEQQPRPVPVEPRDRELEQAVGWLRWEVSVGNSDRPTLEALEERKVSLESVGDTRQLTPGERAVYQDISGELDNRDVQHQQAIAAQDAALARLQARGVGRDFGPDLGL